MDQEKRTDVDGAEVSPVQPPVDSQPIANETPTPLEGEASQPLPVPKAAPKKKPSASASSAAKKSTGEKSDAKKSGKTASKSSGKKGAKSSKSTTRSHSNKDDTNDVRFTTATGNGSQKRLAAKKETVNLDLPRSAKPAHRVIPYVLAILAIFSGLALLFNIFCNQNNALAATPSSHWMGTVGYWVCYWLFGIFGPAVFVLPLLLANLAGFWKKYIDNRLAISKIVASLVIIVLLGAVIHIFCLALWPAADRTPLSSDQLIEVGSQMTMGGLVGGSVGYFLYDHLNIAGSLIIGICLLAAALFYFIGMTPHHLYNYIRMHRLAKREGRGTVSEQDAQAAEYNARMQEKLKRASAKHDADDDISDGDAPVGAVIYRTDGETVEDKPKKEKNKEKDKEDRLAPMPIPMLDPNEGKLFVPADVNRKLAEEARASAPSTERAAAPAPEAAPQPVQPKPANPMANKDTAVDPIFPQTERVARPVPKTDRNFDLGNIFDHNEQKGNPVRRYSPVPPEVPMPGTRPRPAGTAPQTANATNPATAPRPTAAAKPASTVQKATAEGAPKTVAAAKPTAAKPATAPTAKPAAKPVAKPAADASTPATEKPAAQKTTVRQIKALGQKDFGLTNEEFERLEAQNRTLPKAGAKPAPKSADGAEKKPVAIVSKPTQKPKRYVFPPMNYLHEPEPLTAENKEEIKASVEKLRETLANFRINITDVAYSYGPTVTRYEICPPAGVRVRSIINLSDDISLTFASKIRIEAPIPGKSAVGIEVPNKTRTSVFLRQLIDSKAFAEASSKLTAALGADVTGQPLLFDISKMPHLLVAGATGMGKSVCINSIIMSLLYKARPDEVKLILIDPKKVEFGIYKGIPHLLAPIVTAPKDAAGALQAAVEEMENRFELIEQVGVHDIAGYNSVTANDPDMPFMPQIVIIIDELADLMMTAPDEVETAICRLAQKARAAGMHIIIGTQRPSVDVVTGLIKSNIPSRIAFTVASQVDSRTILDVAGAEKLTGKGDMLFAPVGNMGFTRVQGAFVHEKEVEKICEFIRATNGTAVYDERFTSKMKEFSAQCGSKGKSSSEISSLPEGEGKGDDAKYSDAVRIAVEEKKISTSLLQRRLGVGYSRAAKLIDRMQEEGIVSALDGSKPRAILITPEEYIERFVDVPTK